MAGYILHRILVMIPTLFLISVISFVVIELPPGDMASAYLTRMEDARENLSEDTLRQIDALRARFGLDQPAWKRYINWSGRFITGDFGYSFVWRKPVRELISGRIGLTVMISLGTFIISSLITWPIGIGMSVRQYSSFDNIFSFVAFIMMAIPPFMFALVLMYLSFQWFGVAPGGLYSDEFVGASWSMAKFLDLLAHLWMPLLILGLGSIGGGVRVIRANMLDEMRMPYVTTARAKGLSETHLILKYPLRMAANPFVSSIGWMLPGLVGGEVIVSLVLGIPTTGPILLEGIMNQDMQVAGAIIMILAALTVIGTLISDILLAMLDPRIRYQ
jgi:peptide/nickel transport system permease protein